MNKLTSENNFNIKLKKHYKLYVLLKDKIVFESELKKNGIPYYTDSNEQPFIDGGIRYFLLDTDMQNVDRIIKSIGMVANTESYIITDFKDEKNIMNRYIFLIGIVIGFLILISLIQHLFNE